MTYACCDCCTWGTPCSWANKHRIPCTDCQPAEFDLWEDANPWDAA